MVEKLDYKYDDLFNPVLQALHQIGDSGTNAEIEEKVIFLLNLSEAEIDDIHRGNTTKLAYRLAWARNYMKRLGLLENSSRAVWALTAKGRNTPSIDQVEAKRIVKNLSGIKKSDKEAPGDEDDAQEIAKLFWEEEIVEILQRLKGYLSGFLESLVLPMLRLLVSLVMAE